MLYNIYWLRCLLSTIPQLWDCTPNLKWAVGSLASSANGRKDKRWVFETHEMYWNNYAPPTGFVKIQVVHSCSRFHCARVTQTSTWQIQFKCLIVSAQILLSTAGDIQSHDCMSSYSKTTWTKEHEPQNLGFFCYHPFLPTNNITDYHIFGLEHLHHRGDNPRWNIPASETPEMTSEQYCRKLSTSSRFVPQCLERNSWQRDKGYKML